MPSIQVEISCCLPVSYSVAFTQKHTKLLSAKPIPSTSFAAKANTKQFVADLQLIGWGAGQGTEKISFLAIN